MPILAVMPPVIVMILVLGRVRIVLLVMPGFIGMPSIFVLIRMLAIQAQIVAIIAGIVCSRAMAVVGVIIPGPVAAPAVKFGAFGSFLSIP
jgi:hypothetical protein